MCMNWQLLELLLQSLIHSYEFRDKNIISGEVSGDFFPFWYHRNPENPFERHYFFCSVGDD